MHFLSKAGVAAMVLAASVGSVSAATMDNSGAMAGSGNTMSGSTMYDAGAYVYGAGAGFNAEGEFVSNLDYDQWYVYGQDNARYVGLYPQEIARRNTGGIIAKDVQVAIDFVAKNKISKYGTPDTYHPDQNVRRDEVAALFTRAKVLFAPEAEGLGVATPTGACVFSDLSQGYADLQTVVGESCQLGLFHGSNGKFMPTANITNAEALAVLIRMESGLEPEPKPEDHRHWAANYLATAQRLGLTAGLAADSEVNLDKPITRGDIAKLIEAASILEQAKAALKPSVDQELNFSRGDNQYKLQAHGGANMN